MYFKKFSEEQYLAILMTYGESKTKFWTEGFVGYVTIDHDDCNGELQSDYALIIDGVQYAGLLRDRTYGTGDGYYISTFCRSSTFTTTLEEIRAIADNGHIKTMVSNRNHLICEGFDNVS